MSDVLPVRSVAVLNCYMVLEGGYCDHKKYHHVDGVLINISADLSELYEELVSCMKKMILECLLLVALLMGSKVNSLYI